MKMTQLEQSGFIFEADSGFKLAVDIGVYTPLEKIKYLEIDAMIISHFHPDHFSVEHIQELSPVKLYLSQECIDKLGDTPLQSDIVTISTEAPITIADFEVVAFRVDHGPNATVVPRENFGFIFSVDKQKLFFAGDMYKPSGIDISELEVDKLLIPVGGFYTFGPKEAVEYAKKFKRVEEIVPMHYEIDPKTKDEFLDLYNI